MGPPLDLGDQLVPCGAVLVPTRPHLQGKRDGHHTKENLNNVLHLARPLHEPCPRALVADTVDGTTHVDVDKIDVVLVLYVCGVGMWCVYGV